MGSGRPRASARGLETREAASARGLETREAVDIRRPETWEAAGVRRPEMNARGLKPLRACAQEPQEKNALHLEPLGKASALRQ